MPVNTPRALELSNLALREIGENAISSFTDDSSLSDLASLFYDDTVKQMLIVHRWEFAIVQQQLSKLTNETPLTGWANAFAMPTSPEYIRIERVAREADSLVSVGQVAFPRPSRQDYMVRADVTGKKRRLYTDWEEVFLEYVAYVDESVWSPGFDRCIILKLAISFSQASTDNEKLRTELKDELMGQPRAGIPGALTMAKTADSQNSPNRGFVDDGGLVSGR